MCDENMTQEKWDSMSIYQRHKLRDLSGLSTQLIGLEGWRIEVTTTYNETRRFIVGRSTGWRPCHIERSKRNSMGGGAAEKHYSSIHKLYYTR